MTATNHVLAGSLLAAATATFLPVWVLLPTVVMLHFVLDALPHFGQPDNQAAALGRLKWLLPIDGALALIILGSIVLTRPEHWLLMVAAGIACASPDIMWLPKFWRFINAGVVRSRENKLMAFHRAIQREYMWGIWVEAGFFVIGAVSLTRVLF